MDTCNLNIVLAGHVDHGKSTLIGRLLSDLGQLQDGKIAAVEQQCAKRGMAFEWAFVLDALQAERDQGITIDTTQVVLRDGERHYTLIDAPGHTEFLRNAITGLARADACLLVLDAAEPLAEQAKRHALLLSLAGVERVIVLVNKMDRVRFAKERFDALAGSCGEYLEKLKLKPLAVIPVAARDGENLVKNAASMAWYKGPTVMEALKALSDANTQGLPLRLPIQDVYKFDDRRIIAGRIDSGALKVGDEILISPLNTTSKITGIEAWPEAKKQGASACESVGITLADPLFAERGHVVSHADTPPKLANLFRTRMFWLDHEPLQQEARYRIRIGHRETLAEVRRIECVINPGTLERSASAQLERNAIGDVVWRTRAVVAVDDAPRSMLSRMVILRDHRIVGGGVISMEGFADLRAPVQAAKSQHITPHAQGITIAQRAQANGHSGGILWFTGLSGAGKTTLAQALQKALFAKGYQAFVLDGDNIRKGLNRDLGFSAEDRRENLRRAGEVAALFAQAGFIVITAFISPVEEDRASARAAAPDFYHSVYIKAGLDTCEKRDAKGLYSQARAGKIADFTGISAPYDPPENPDLVIDTERNDVQVCVAQLMRYVERQFVEAKTGEADL